MIKYDKLIKYGMSGWHNLERGRWKELGNLID